MSRAKIYGILSIYREHLPDFASISEPIRELLSNDAIPWGDGHSALAKSIASQLLESQPMLNYDPAETTRLVVHTGKVGMAGVLLQRDPMKRTAWLPVGSFSRVWTPMEGSYSVVELELVAI